ncbi:MAG: MAE_28990/MAE_18760 family HEPN-like nuclease [Polynucleobacter sp.]|uniref:MAE_28990/MAE_18760 family HEPN-like nuclease n=1 Tax=Hydrogenophaga sp. TaxID=1904254 RepID=UPI002ABB59BF|nr:MAE_28990/MAE_18760 family HEPN-like nuclease [Hydrogenophaga sp.]MDZ4055795.1 MAE_28990/MAE_18760 family HEPN-like nuclease [Polynucleobacter sp.]MDZ4284014.1 MAE_28990/MAE_18760 family HEPN-like nuclease [Hydrogenophaga sp.]
MSQVSLTDALLRDRSVEVSAYLDFLKVAVERRAVLNAKDGDLVFPLSQQLTHTLKANVVLLLYSAMEATLVQLLDEMHEAIGNNCSSADALNVDLLRVVLKTVKKDKSATVHLSAAPLHKSLFTYWISDWQGRTSAKDKRVDGISGSVDSLVFYEQLRKFGVVEPTVNDRPPTHLTDRALQKVKTSRNELAHGEKSFTDLGRELSVQSLEADSVAVFDTLRKIADEVDKYLQDRRYLAQPPGAEAERAAEGSEA